MVGEAAAGHQVELKLVWNRAVQDCGHWSCVIIEHLKRGCSKLRCAIRVKCLLDIKNLAQKRL